jgi:hypothetical protein
MSSTIASSTQSSLMARKRPSFKGEEKKKAQEIILILVITVYVVFAGISLARTGTVALIVMRVETWQGRWQHFSGEPQLILLGPSDHTITAQCDFNGSLCL